MRRIERYKLGVYLFTVIAAILICGMPANAQDQGWPRQVVKSSGTVVLYQPQVDDWKDYKLIDVRMAFSLTPAGGTAHVGVVVAQLRSSVNMDDHTVFLDSPQITGIYFPTLDAVTTTQMDHLLRSFLRPSFTTTISLDRLAASVKKEEAPTIVAVNNDPPTIFISMRSAILLFVNGTPTFAPIKGSKLKFVVNANWPLFTDDDTYYLFNGNGWMKGSDIKGPWTATEKLPRHMSEVAEDTNFANLKPFIPPPPGSASAVPTVYYSATPAEIIVFNGSPVWNAIPGTQLASASNTQSTVFEYTPTGALYYLTSGRWFTSVGTQGQWAFATNSLPSDFRRIPPNSPESVVLASVPGTPEAEDAVLIARIPTTVKINSAQAAEQVKVVYVGQPQFVPIDGTTMLYAANTQNRVIQVGLQYYVCYQGVWFNSFNPMGPWQIANVVPQVIYTIPPNSPVYNVTYVTQTIAPGGFVFASYTSGYVGMFVMGATFGAVVTWGTGFYYPPYIYNGWYCPYAVTYGWHTYNTYTGAYGYAGAAYGPYGSAHWATSYNPYTGTYARGGTVNTPYGKQTAGQAYNPYTGAYAATHQTTNAYGSWGQSVVSKNGTTVNTQHQTNANGSEASFHSTTGAKGGAVSTANGSSAFGKTANNDMYAGHDGNVYKNTGSGWQKYDNGSWNAVQPPNDSNLKSDQNNQSHAGDNVSSASNNQPRASQDVQQHSDDNPTSNAQPRANNGSSRNDLSQEQQNRQRGTEQSQRFSQFSSGDRGGAGRSWGGGNRNWGGGNRFAGRR
jgi:hypothetical protein